MRAGRGAGWGQTCPNTQCLSLLQWLEAWLFVLNQRNLRKSSLPPTLAGAGSGRQRGGHIRFSALHSQWSAGSDPPPDLRMRGSLCFNHGFGQVHLLGKKFKSLLSIKRFSSCHSNRRGFDEATSSCVRWNFQESQGLRSHLASCPDFTRRTAKHRGGGDVPRVTQPASFLTARRQTPSYLPLSKSIVVLCKEVQGGRTVAKAAGQTAPQPLLSPWVPRAGDGTGRSRTASFCPGVCRRSWESPRLGLASLAAAPFPGAQVTRSVPRRLSWSCW